MSLTSPPTPTPLTAEQHRAQAEEWLGRAEAAYNAWHANLAHASAAAAIATVHAILAAQPPEVYVQMTPPTETYVRTALDRIAAATQTGASR